MAKDFNWHTDEDDRWEEIEQPRPAPRKPRRWLRLLLSFILVAGAVGGIAWRLTSQVNEATSTVSQDVLASQELYERAARNRDIELFTSVLSGREPGWTEGQKQLLRSGQLLDFPQFGLDWLGPAPAPVEGTVTMSPDLRSATVATEQLYSVAIGNGLTETVRLRHETVFRQGTTRWLLAPPLPDYWGAWQTVATGRIKLEFPAREASFAEPFALDLDAKLSELCRLFNELNCPDRWQVNVRFDPSPGALFSSGYGDVAWQATTEIQLPAPSLVGLPVDDAAYQALFRGYSAAILQQVIGAQVGYDCCAGRLLFQALVDFQLAQLALRPWPLGPSDFESLLLKSVTIYDASVWDPPIDPVVGTTTWQQAYGLIAFSQAGTVRHSLVSMQRGLRNRGGLTAWQNQFLAPTAFNGDPENAWRQFLYANGVSVNQPPPVAWPQQEVYLTCHDGRQIGHEMLMSFDPRTGQSQNLATVDEIARLTSLPNDNGAIIETLANGQPYPTLTIWRTDGPNLVFEGDSEHGGVTDAGFHDPSGRFIALNYWGPDKTFDYNLLDLNQCAGTNCVLRPLAGIPIWSPTGEATILVNPTERSILLGDAFGQVTVQFDKAGDRPVWINEEQFVYLFQGEPHIGWRNLKPTEPLLAPDTFDAMRSQLGLDASEALIIQTVLPNPNDANRLYIAALGGRQEHGAVFEYDMVARSLSLRFTVPETPYEISMPAGNAWLQLQYMADRARTTYTLFAPHDAGQAVLSFDRPAEPGNDMDWSDNAQWLVMANGNDLQFLAPAFAYQRIVSLDAGLACSQAIWVNTGQELLQVPAGSGS